MFTLFVRCAFALTGTFNIANLVNVVGYGLKSQLVFLSSYFFVAGGSWRPWQATALSLRFVWKDVAAKEGFFLSTYEMTFGRRTKVRMAKPARPRKPTCRPERPKWPKRAERFRSVPPGNPRKGLRTLGLGYALSKGNQAYAGPQKYG